MWVTTSFLLCHTSSLPSAHLADAQLRFEPAQSGSWPACVLPFHTLHCSLSSAAVLLPLEACLHSSQTGCSQQRSCQCIAHVCHVILTYSHLQWVTCNESSLKTEALGTNECDCDSPLIHLLGKFEKHFDNFGPMKMNNLHSKSSSIMGAYHFHLVLASLQSPCYIPSCTNISSLHEITLANPAVISIIWLILFEHWWATQQVSFYVELYSIAMTESQTG